MGGVEVDGAETWQDDREARQANKKVRISQRRQVDALALK